MIESEKDFQRMMEGVRVGNEEAAWELVATYGESLRRAVRRVLNVRLRSQFDSIDFVQLVWKSFFCSENVSQHFDSPAQLVAFLASMACNKVRMESRKRLRSTAYDIGREERLDDLADVELPADAGKNPLPIDVAIARERWKQLVEDQPQHYREIIRLRLSGLSCEAIAGELHLNKATVYRFLEKLMLSTAKT
jgi:RNA polymerase sigma-70 factor (ECF subfamily)